jgi:hypothetical protein
VQNRGFAHWTMARQIIYLCDSLVRTRRDYTCGGELGRFSRCSFLGDFLGLAALLCLLLLVAINSASLDVLDLFDHESTGDSIQYG